MTRYSLLARTLNKAGYRSFLVSKRALQALRSGPPDQGAKSVVFVAGVQRSGTNMLMDVLERSLETDVYHERDDRAFDGYEMRPPEVIRHLVEKSRARRVVVKALCELQDLRRLMHEFTPSRSVWLLRRYEDVVNSHLALWSGMPASIGRIAQDMDSAGWRGRGMSAETHDLVRALYHPGITNASACALFWYLRNVLFFEQGFEHDGRVCLVRYEHLVSRPHQIFAELFEFLGIRYTPWVSRKVVASSVRKRPAPAIDDGIRRICEELTGRFDTVSAPLKTLATYGGASHTLYGSRSVRR